MPVEAERTWLDGRSVQLEPFASGTIHTTTDLAALPPAFHVQFPNARTYRPLWARERDVAAYLHAELHHALKSRLSTNRTKLELAEAPSPSAVEHSYHASGHLQLGGFRPVLFDPRARQLGDTPLGDDESTPFRKAYLVPTSPAPSRVLRLVTGYVGLHCMHELVGRRNRDWQFTQLDWLVALVDTDSKVVAEAYVGATSNTWRCPATAEAWSELVDEAAAQVTDALFAPKSD